MTERDDPNLVGWFEDGLEIAASERAAWMDQRGIHEPEARRRLETLWAAADVDDAFLLQQARIDAEPLASSRHLLPVGHRLGQLRIEGILGIGGSGVVYRATDTKRGRTVALKALHPAHSDAAAHGLAEARALEQLDHPGIVALYDVHAPCPASAERWTLEMEFVAGGTLGGHLRSVSPGPARARALATAITESLAFAHDRDVVHGDLKPANILLADDGSPRLADFGLARLAREDDGSRAEDVVGSPPYAAPEVLRGGVRTPASDLWSLGVVLYELACGSSPFPGTTVGAVVYGVLAGTVAVPADAVDTTLLEVALDCLQKEPGRRPASARHVLESLTAPERPAPRAHRREGAGIVGRAHELGLLLRALLDGGARRGTSAHVRGVAGIGKTTLVREVASEATARGWQVLTIDVDPSDGLLLPALRALRNAWLETSPSASANQESVVSRALAVCARLEPSSTEAPLESRAQMVWAAEQLLGALAARRPVIVVLEDVHLLDAAEVTALRQLENYAHPHGVRMLVSARTGEPHVNPPVHSARAREAVVQLGPLSQDAAHRLFLRTARVTQAEGAVVRRILDRVQGHPLHLQETLQHALGGGSLVRDGDRLVAGGSWDPTLMAPSIREAVRHRLANLGAQERQLLELAAVYGQEFEAEALARALDLSLIVVLQVLEGLHRDKHYVEPTSTGFRFAHGLHREVLYEGMPPPLRRKIHAQAAAGLERASRAEDAEAIGRHWTEAGRNSRARPFLLRAAQDAARRQAMIRTVELCELAGIEAAGDLDAHPRDAETLLGLGLALADVGRSDDAARVFNAVRESAARSGDAITGGRVDARAARALLPYMGAKGVDEAAMLSALHVLPPCRERGDALYSLGLAAKYAGRHEEAQRWLERADAAFLEADDPSGHSSALDQLGGIARFNGDLRRAEALFREAGRISAGEGRRLNAAVSEANAGLALYGIGDLDGLDARLRRTIRVLELEEAKGRIEHVSLILALVRYAQGGTKDALEIAQQARERIEDDAYLSALPHAWLTEGEFRAVLGDTEGARGCYEQARRTAESSGQPVAGLVADVLEGLSRAYDQDCDRAVATLQAALAGLQVEGSRLYRDDAVLRLAEGRCFGLAPAVANGVERNGLSKTTHAVFDVFGDDAALARALRSIEHGPQKSTRLAVSDALAARAAWQEGARDDGVQGMARALARADQIDHVPLQRACLRSLIAWTGDAEYEAQLATRGASRASRGG